MFSQYDGDSDGAVTINELFQMVKGHRRLADPFGVRSLPSLPFFFSEKHSEGRSDLRSGEQLSSNGGRHGFLYKRRERCIRKIFVLCLM